MEKTVKCNSCGEEIIVRDEPDEEIFTDYDGNIICQGCDDDDLNTLIASIVLYNEGEKVDCWRFGRCHIASDSGGYDEFTDDVIEKIVRGTKWVSSDAWRGCFDVTCPEGYIKVLNTWFGSVDGYFHGDEYLKKFYEKIKEEKSYPDFPVYVIFPRTSNCCSYGIEVLVKAENMKKYYDWLGIEQPEGADK